MTCPRHLDFLGGGGGYRRYMRTASNLFFLFATLASLSVAAFARGQPIPPEEGKFKCPPACPGPNDDVELKCSEIPPITCIRA